MNNQIKLSCAALVFALAGPAAAATTWTLGPTDPAGVIVSGVANTGTGSPANSQRIELQPKPTNMIWYSGGWGINNLDGCSSPCSGDAGDLAGLAPEHAIDNEQRYEMALLNFTSSKVKLTGLQIGWSSTDSDMTVMAYTGTTPFAMNTNLVGRTYAELVSYGWTAIGNYANASTSSPLAINAAGVFSSYWLIGAYNPLANNAGGLTDNNDYVKLFSVTGSLPNTTQSVAEPGSLALVAVALLTMGRLRRRKESRA
ncbi:MAG: exosortase-dependent surface protein XDP1 [Burkholderiales bacterium]